MGQEEYFERVHVMKALVGSHNYNLSTPESDKDYKIFVMPTILDLYKGKMYSKATISSTFDYDLHDVRKLSQLFWKANINFLEVLYSTEYYIFNRHIKEIYDLRKEIVRMNLPYLYNACRGMHFEKMKRLDKSSDGTQFFVEQHGYNTKEALHAYRVLDFIIRFATTEFEDFEWAMRYDEQGREKMLTIKNGEFSKDQFENLVFDKMKTFNAHRDLYCRQIPNQELIDRLEQIIYSMVCESITMNT